MGSIQNSIVGALGAAAGAAVAIEHTKDSDFSKMNSADNSAIIARNQARAATAEANEATNEAKKDGGLISQLSEAEVAEGEAKKAFEKAANRKNGSPITMLNKMTELKAAKKAADTLRDKYKAVEGLQARATEQRRYAAKATQIALDEKTKYEKRWGGIK